MLQSEVASALDGIYREMAPNSFRRINLNQISDVWTPEDKRVSGRLGAGYEARIAGILNAWGGVAWNPDLGQILAFGGGHFSYPGNEPYYFSVLDRQWHRACLPSDIVADRERQQIFPILSDTSTVSNYPPPSTHTYDRLVWLPWIQRYLLLDPTNFYASYPRRYGGNNLSDQENLIQAGPWLLDPSRFDKDKVCGQTGTGVDPADEGVNAWTNLDWKTRLGKIFGTRSASVNPERQEVYALGRGRRGLKVLTVTQDGKADRIEDLGMNIGTGTTIGGSAYVPHLDAIIFVNQKNFFVRKLGLPRDRGSIIEPLNLSAPAFPKLGKDAGFDYDPINRIATLWQGGEKGESVVWELTVPDNLDKGNWVLRRNVQLSGPADGPELINGKWINVGPGRFIGVRDGDRGEVWAYQVPAKRPSF